MFKDRSFAELLDFNYDINHKVHGLLDEEEAFEMFHEGFITKLFEPDHPKTIGVFEIMVYDLHKAKKLGKFANIMKMMGELSEDYGSRFTRINELIEDYDLNFKEKDRIVFLKNCIILPEYRGKGILDELIKSIYITHFTRNTLFICNTIPIQDLEEELDFHMHDYEIDIVNDGNDISVMSGNYFKLNKLPESDEINEYKLYAKMLKLNLKQFKDSHFFYQDNDEGFLKIFKNEKTSNIKKSI
jgi:hypothetical protein